MSIDGTDFQIQEPTPFSPVWFSHKFNGPALRYEIAVCIQTGWIMWTGGPYPAGDFPDIEIYRLGLMERLRENERVEDNEGYSGELSVCTPSDYDGNIKWRRMKGRARTCHEAVNGKLKEFGVLSNVYRGNQHHHFYTIDCRSTVFSTCICRVSTKLLTTILREH